MPRLILWKDEQMGKLRKDMDRLYHRVYGDFGIPLLSTALREVPLMDLSDMESTLIVRAKMANIDPKDLDVSVNHDTLRIRVQGKKDSEGYRQAQRRHGFFSRTLQLPCRIDVDEVKATYSKGTLTIVMPKCKPEKTRKIKIKIS